MKQVFYWHRSTCIVAVGTAIVLLCMMVPGELLSSRRGVVGPYYACYAHGWPCTHLRREVEYSSTSDNPDIPKWGIPWLALDSWKFLHADERKFSMAAFATNLSCLIVIVVVATAGFEVWRRNRNRVWQYGMVDILAVLLLVGILMGWLQWEKRNSIREDVHVDAIIKGGHQVYSEFPWWTFGFQKLMGRESLPRYLGRIEAVFFTRYSDDEFVMLLPHLRALRGYELTLTFDVIPGISALPFSQLKSLTQLRVLDLSECGVTDRAVPELLTLKQLRQLYLVDSLLTPEGIHRLKNGLPGCEIRLEGYEDEDEDWPW